MLTGPDELDVEIGVVAEKSEYDAGPNNVWSDTEHDRNARGYGHSPIVQSAVDSLRSDR